MNKRLYIKTHNRTSNEGRLFRIEVLIRSQQCQIAALQLTADHSPRVGCVCMHADHVS